MSWLEKRKVRVEEIRSRSNAYYSWEHHSEYVIAKDELLSKAPVDIDYLLGEYDVMFKVIKELVGILEHDSMCRECAETSWRVCSDVKPYLTEDIKELFQWFEEDDN